MQDQKAGLSIGKQSLLPLLQTFRVTGGLVRRVGRQVVQGRVEELRTTFGSCMGNRSPSTRATTSSLQEGLITANPAFRNEGEQRLRSQPASKAAD